MLGSRKASVLAHLSEQMNKMIAKQQRQIVVNATALVL